LSSPWIRRPSVVDGFGIVQSSIAAAARFRGQPCPGIVNDTALDVQGPMTRSSSKSPTFPLLLDVLSELHKPPCFFVELGLHLVELLKGKCALGPFLSILVIKCQHKWFKCETMPNGGRCAKSTQRYDSRLSTLVFVY
jgi:hypothetical protein